MPDRNSGFLAERESRPALAILAVAQRSGRWVAWRGLESASDNLLAKERRIRRREHGGSRGAESLDRLGRKEMPIVIGGVIPPQDYDELYKDGTLAIFGPGTVLPEVALKVLQILEPQETSAHTSV